MRFAAYNIHISESISLEKQVQIINVNLWGPQKCGGPVRPHTPHTPHTPKSATAYSSILSLFRHSGMLISFEFIILKFLILWSSSSGAQFNDNVSIVYIKSLRFFFSVYVNLLNKLQAGTLLQ